MKMCSDENLKHSILQYLANKLFPKWLTYCSNLTEVQRVFKCFSQLCNSETVFCHSSAEVINIGLSAL